MKMIMYSGKLDASGNLFIKDGIFRKWRPIKCEYNSKKPCGNWCKKFGKPELEFIYDEDDEDNDNDKKYITRLRICYDNMIFRHFFIPEREDR